jgi:hypothetical protein
MLVEILPPRGTGSPQRNALRVNDRNVLSGFTTSAAVGATNETRVTFQAVDGHGVAINYPVVFDLYLADAADGSDITSATASGAVQAHTASGLVIATPTAKKALTVRTLANGTFVLSITDTAKTQFYPVAIVPATGQPIVGTRILTANYG